MDNKIKEKIRKLKKERSAIILAHVYQRDEVQDVADYIGDSLDLSKKALETKAKVIVFCGVRFMAETSAVLNPDKIVLLPERNAGCLLADMATIDQLRKKKAQYPNAVVVSYINTSAAVKAESDICCTSANAVNVVKSLRGKQVLFVPDKNLGKYVASKTDREIGKNLFLWDGYCYVHEKNITKNKIKELKSLHPRAKVIVHPECNPLVIDLADYAGSTTQMLRYAKRSNNKEFIVGTEDGIIYLLSKQNPEKKFYPLNTICKDMKLINLKSIVLALQNLEHQVIVPEDIRIRAKRALDKMLEICT